MKTFLVTIEIKVQAESPTDAMNIGIGAAEHLNDTFNDDGSLDPLMRVEVKIETNQKG
ncbi:MAG TPA: hypothetical protein PLN42_06680 [Anaerolineae bacterium]|nr:hypothetical protein [Anaerolineae bacterium]